MTSRHITFSVSSRARPLVLAAVLVSAALLPAHGEDKAGTTGGSPAAAEPVTTGLPALAISTAAGSGTAAQSGIAPSVVVPASEGAESPKVEPQQAVETAPARDPILLAVQERLAEAGARFAADVREDRRELAAFYGTRTQAPLWVGPNGLSARGLAVTGEIAKAADWGLAPMAFELPDLRTAGSASAVQRADEEIRISLAVLKYARHARGGRLDPSQVSRNFDVKPQLLSASTALAGIAAATAPDAYLRGLHPPHPQFERLRQALLATRTGKVEAEPKPTEPNTKVKIPDGPVLKIGQEHDNVVALRQRLGVPAGDAGDTSRYDEKLADAVKAFQKANGVKQTGTLDKATRGALSATAAKPPANREQLLVANMERWRWLPADMGEFHVWDNIPEYQARVVSKGQVVHQARIIVGKVETQTPLFSADMRYVVFHPGWGVPDSIKVKELLPYLRRSQTFFGGGETDTAVLRRHNLVVSHNGRPVDPASIDWQQTDIRRYQFVQPPGASNVLGVVKFRFPNKHDVYMHDTSQRDLFNQSRRTFSHGCVRIDNPRRLAELLLAHDRGMPAAEVGRLLTSGPKDNQIELKAKIPVHITYFTAVAEADGTIKTHNDIYGHDARVTAALAGRPMALEPAPDNTPVAVRVPKQPRPVKQAQSNDFFSGLFGN